jgi:hypothetical protein
MKLTRSRARAFASDDAGCLVDGEGFVQSAAFGAADARRRRLCNEWIPGAAGIASIRRLDACLQINIVGSGKSISFLIGMQ